MNNGWKWAIASYSAGMFLMAPEIASAQEFGTGVEAGGRIGYGIPFGKMSDADNADLKDGISGQVPLWFDLGYRVTPEVLIGAFGTVGFGIVGDDLDETCDVDEVDCKARDFRLGAQLHYHIAPLSPPDPWLGLGFGYEWLKIAADGPGGEITTKVRGFEFLNLQAGLDFKPTEHLLIGPFLAFTLGQYSKASVDCSGPGCGAVSGLGVNDEIDDKALHEWLFLGLRIAYGP